MLVSQRPVSGSSERHGCHRQVLAELQRGATSDCEEGLRQRLMVLAERLARVQALGNEFARVAFSGHVRSILGETASAV